MMALVLLAVLALFTACGGQVAETPEERFVEAACAHVGCKGWATDYETCAVSFRKVVEPPQDATCLDAASAVLERSGCGNETNTAADDVVDGKCRR